MLKICIVKRTGVYYNKNNYWGCSQNIKSGRAPFSSIRALEIVDTTTET